MSVLTRYPLCWPAGWPRTSGISRVPSKFSKGERKYSSDYTSSWRARKDLSVFDGVSRVIVELERMSIRQDDMLVSTNIPTRLDGLPRSDSAKPQDVGAAVYWRDRKGRDRCMAIDRYDTVAGNLAAIAATLEALRAVERHGGAVILDRAFTGFTALPSNAPAEWRDVLGLQPGERNRDVIRSAYMTRRGAAHPDRAGGDATEFNRVQQAWEQAQREIGA